MAVAAGDIPGEDSRPAEGAEDLRHWPVGRRQRSVAAPEQKDEIGYLITDYQGS